MPRGLGYRVGPTVPVNGHSPTETDGKQKIVRESTMIQTLSTLILGFGSEAGKGLVESAQRSQMTERAEPDPGVFSSTLRTK